MECFGVPGLSLDWSIETKKSRALVGSTGVLPRGAQVKTLGGRGSNDHKAVGEVTSGT